MSADLRRLFDRFDKDRSGTIDARELGKLLDAHGSGNDEGVLAALASLKTAHEGRISWDEFHAWWSRVASAPRGRPAPAHDDESEPAAPKDGEATPPDLRAIFERYDRDGSGEMDARELGSLLEALGMDPDDAAVAATMKQLDTDGSGRISFDELSAWWDEL